MPEISQSLTPSQDISAKVEKLSVTVDTLVLSFKDLQTQVNKINDTVVRLDERSQIGKEHTQEKSSDVKWIIMLVITLISMLLSNVISIWKMTK